MKYLKQFLCLVVSLNIVFALFPAYVFAESKYQYGVLKVAKSDDINNIYSMNVMVNNGVLLSLLR